MTPAERIDLCIRFLRQHGYEVITPNSVKTSAIQRDRVVSGALHSYGVGALLTLKEVASMLGAVGSTTIYSWIDKQGFPKPIKLGKRMARWNSLEVIEWIKHRQDLAQIKVDDAAERAHGST